MKIAYSLLVAAVGGALAASTVGCGDAKPPADPSVNPAGAATGGPAAPEAKHACKGQNDCKGQGGCKSSDNGCKGKNSCKGKGGCATDGSKPPQF